MKKHVLLCQTYRPPVVSSKFPKSGPAQRGKWLIQSTKHHKDSQLQSLELPCRKEGPGAETSWM